jgi:serine/threonine protein kinase
MVGRGAFGCVYRAEDLAAQQACVALKVIPLACDPLHPERPAPPRQCLEMSRQVLREVQMLHRSRSCRNVVDLLDLGLCGAPLPSIAVMVFPSFPRDLGDAIAPRRGAPPLPQRLVAHVMHQLLVGVASLHRRGVWHRDIKPQNVLVDDDWGVVLCDLGMGRLFPPGGSGGSAGGLHMGSPRAAAVAPEAALPPPSRGDATPPRDAAAADVFCREASLLLFEQSEKRKASLLLFEQSEKRKARLEASFRKPSPRLSSHVTTLWYRAPELCGRSPVYTSAVDLFAVGCVMAELLSDGVALFRGCLTPAQVLHTLSRLVGAAPAHVLRGFGDPRARQLASRCGGARGLAANVARRNRVAGMFRTRPTCEDDDAKCWDVRVVDADLHDGPPSTHGPSPLALDLLAQLLDWDPAARPTAESALRHPFFSDCRLLDADLDADLDLGAEPGVGKAEGGGCDDKAVRVEAGARRSGGGGGHGPGGGGAGGTGQADADAWDVQASCECHIRMRQLLVEEKVMYWP